MKTISRLFLPAFALVLAVAFRPEAGHAVELDKRVQDGLIAAQPVRGPAVDRALFNGKPVLVVFFASW